MPQDSKQQVLAEWERQTDGTDHVAFNAAVVADTFRGPKRVRVLRGQLLSRLRSGYYPRRLEEMRAELERAVPVDGRVCPRAPLAEIDRALRLRGLPYDDLHRLWLGIHERLTNTALLIDASVDALDVKAASLLEPFLTQWGAFDPVEDELSDEHPCAHSYVLLGQRIEAVRAATSSLASDLRTALTGWAPAAGVGLVHAKAWPPVLDLVAALLTRQVESETIARAGLQIDSALCETIMVFAYATDALVAASEESAPHEVARLVREVESLRTKIENIIERVQPYVADL
jgi:hypothetical protein